ncbi:MAG: hypothetical protein NC826_06225 [Candidatus Omnitrophica bacterium]|nr:hypothetical protein [Candidatus Omnitrophota bacterium]
MIYEFICSECHTKFEVKATLAEKEKGLKPECPNCHSKKTIQVFGGFMVKGGSKSNSFSPTNAFIPRCRPSAGRGCCG